MQRFGGGLVFKPATSLGRKMVRVQGVGCRLQGFNFRVWGVRLGSRPVVLTAQSTICKFWLSAICGAVFG